MGATLNGKPIKWSWESLWALACTEHQPWIKAAYDDTYVTWLEEQVTAFRQAYKLVQETIEKWEAINHEGEQTLNGVIDNDQYLSSIEAIQRSMHPDMIGFDPELLPSCLQRVKDDGILLSGELARATWKPPVSWTP